MWPLSNGRTDKEPKLIHLYKPEAYKRFLFCLQIKGWEDLTISRVWVKRKKSKSQLHQVHLLLLLSFQSRPTLCDPIEGSPLGFSRQEHWSGLPFPSPMKVKSESEIAQLCPTLRDLMNCSPPGPSVHGIFQARVLEWVAIAFSASSSARSKPRGPNLLHHCNLAIGRVSNIFN